MTEDPRETLGDLSERIAAHLGPRLVGLYLFGSLAAGTFYAGRSDLDLLAVVDADVADGDDLQALREMHESFETGIRNGAIASRCSISAAQSSRHSRATR